MGSFELFIITRMDKCAYCRMHELPCLVKKPFGANICAACSHRPSRTCSFREREKARRAQILGELLQGPVSLLRTSQSLIRDLESGKVDLKSAQKTLEAVAMDYAETLELVGEYFWAGMTDRHQAVKGVQAAIEAGEACGVSEKCMEGGEMGGK